MGSGLGVPKPNKALHPGRQVGRPERGPTEATPEQIANWRAQGYGKPQANTAAMGAIVPGKGGPRSFKKPPGT